MERMTDSVYHLLQFHLRIVAASAVSDFFMVCDVYNPYTSVETLDKVNTNHTINCV